MAENEYLRMHQKQRLVEDELTSFSEVLDKIKEKKETLEQQRKELVKDKPRSFDQNLDGVMQHDGDLISPMEDAEDELSEKISKIQVRFRKGMNSLRVIRSILVAELPLVTL